MEGLHLVELNISLLVHNKAHSIGTSHPIFKQESTFRVSYT